MSRTIPRGDTYPPLTGQVSDADGPVPLGSADEVLLLFKTPRGLVRAPVEVVDPGAVRGEPDAGRWRRSWVVTDTARAGECPAEVQVTWAPGLVTTFATATEKIVIVQDLNETT